MSTGQMSKTSVFVMAESFRASVMRVRPRQIPRKILSYTVVDVPGRMHAYHS